MEQIINRLFNIIKSYSVNDDAHPKSYINQKDEELKRIIDELNNPKSSSSKNESSYKSNSEAGNDKSAHSQVIDYSKALYLLGLTDNSSIEQIKNAYKQKIKEYHPDKVQSLGKELQDLALRKTSEINTAYQLIRKVKGF